MCSSLWNSALGALKERDLLTTEGLHSVDKEEMWGLEKRLMDREAASVMRMCIVTVCLRIGRLFYSWFEKTKLEKEDMKYVLRRRLLAKQ